MILDINRFGANICISPLSEITDGLINLILMNKINKMRIPFALWGFLKGKHIHKDYASHYVCKDVKVENLDERPVVLDIDGELYDELPFLVNIVEKGLHIYCHQAQKETYNE